MWLASPSPPLPPPPNPGVGDVGHRLSKLHCVQSILGTDYRFGVQIIKHAFLLFPVGVGHILSILGLGYWTYVFSGQFWTRIIDSGHGSSKLQFLSVNFGHRLSILGTDYRKYNFSIDVGLPLAVLGHLWHPCGASSRFNLKLDTQMCKTS
jgi:hypothetical protein